MTRKLKDINTGFKACEATRGVAEGSKFNTLFTSLTSPSVVFFFFCVLIYRPLIGSLCLLMVGTHTHTHQQGGHMSIYNHVLYK